MYYGYGTPETTKAFVLYGRTMEEAFRAAKKIVQRNANFGAISIDEENKVIRMVRNPTWRDQNYTGQEITIAVAQAVEMGAEVAIRSCERSGMTDSGWNLKNIKQLISEIEEEAREDLREAMGVKPLYEKRAYQVYRAWVMGGLPDEKYEQYITTVRSWDGEQYAEYYGEEKPVTGTISCKHCRGPVTVTVGQVTKCEYCGSLIKCEL